MRKIYISILLLLFLFVAPALSKSRNTILILHSYGRDYRWTEELHEGFVNGVSDFYGEADFRVEYMDSKNYLSDEYSELMLNLWRYKYKGVKFDGIFITDDNAFSMYRERISHALKGVPVVVVGVSSLNNYENLEDDVTFLEQTGDYLRTVDLAIAQNPMAENLWFLVDDTVTGNGMKESVLKTFVNHPMKDKIRFYQSRNLFDVERFLSTLTEKDLVFLLIYFNLLRDGRLITYREAVESFTEASSQPIYVFWRFYMGHGVIGGYVTDSIALGYEAGHIMSKILSGDKVAPVWDVSKKVNRYMADWKVMERFGFFDISFPAGTYFMGRPKSYFEVHRSAILIALTVLAVFFIISVMLAVLLKQKSDLLEKETRLLSLSEEVRDDQRELIYILGEVVETRSNETAYHVKRVAAMASSLASWIGLSDEECEMVEIAAPMHDLGKIAIPDAILNKPGPLTDEEFKIVKGHPQIGYSILKNSGRSSLKIASVIAREHHERWDGKGYPRRLAGRDISIYARIVTVVDVFDALSSARSYKKPWPLDDIVKYMKDQRGGLFDPRIADVFLDHLEDVLKIQRAFPDS